MKRFNICKNYHTIINHVRIPYGALYGKDITFWYCINKTPLPLDTPTLEIYRYDEYTDEWYLLLEQSSFVAKYVELIARTGYDKVLVQYPRLTGIHDIAEHADQVIRRNKPHTLKRSSLHYARRAPQKQDPLDIWEKVVCHVW